MTAINAPPAADSDSRPTSRDASPSGEGPRLGDSSHIGSSSAFTAAGQVRHVGDGGSAPMQIPGAFHADGPALLLGLVGELLLPLLAEPLGDRDELFGGGEVVGLRLGGGVDQVAGVQTGLRGRRDGVPEPAAGDGPDRQAHDGGQDRRGGPRCMAGTSGERRRARGTGRP